jgi:hypothetical protein
VSEVVRVGVVAEGPTDHAILEQVLAALLKPKDLVYTALQPELSVAFSAVASDLGFGWGGVFKWAQQVRDEGGGSLSGSMVLQTFDLLIIQIDCDVASATYSDIGISDGHCDLPCAMPCPPASDTTQQLESVLLRWLGAPGRLPQLVFCIPAQAMEGWVLAALYPEDPVVVGHGTDCLRDPASRLSAKPASGRMVAGGRKRVDVYRGRAPEIAARWHAVLDKCPSASRFDLALRAARTLDRNT